MSIATKVEDRPDGLRLHIAARLHHDSGPVTFPGGNPNQLTAVGKAAYTGIHAVNGVAIIYVGLYRIDVVIAEAFDRKQVVVDILDGVRAAIKAATGEDLDVEHVEAVVRGGSPDNPLDRYLMGVAAVRAADPSPPWAGPAAQVLAVMRTWLADAGVDLDDPKVARATLATVLFVDQVAREGGGSEDRRATVAYDLLQKLTRLLADMVQQHGDSR
jgi:hypothetical protein